jgi:WhiB family transcriptional regulator, redox-sensing transcriptional regulator
MVPDAEDLTTISELFGQPAWQRYAACRGENVGTFIRTRGGNFNAARELCRHCSVRQECFDFAMGDDELVGMWGGTTEAERQRLRAGRGVA